MRVRRGNLPEAMKVSINVDGTFVDLKDWRRDLDICPYDRVSIVLNVVFNQRYFEVLDFLRPVQH